MMVISMMMTTKVNSAEIIKLISSRISSNETHIS